MNERKHGPGRGDANKKTGGAARPQKIVGTKKQNAWVGGGWAATCAKTGRERLDGQQSICLIARMYLFSSVEPGHEQAFHGAPLSRPDGREHVVLYPVSVVPRQARLLGRGDSLKKSEQNLHTYDTIRRPPQERASEHSVVWTRQAGGSGANQVGVQAGQAGQDRFRAFKYMRVSCPPSSSIFVRTAAAQRTEALLRARICASAVGKQAARKILPLKKHAKLRNDRRPTSVPYDSLSVCGKRTGRTDPIKITSQRAGLLSQLPTCRTLLG